MTAIIETEHLTKRFGNITALANVSTVVQGKLVGLLGPNGAGKSTLLKALLGVMPYEGKARVLGFDCRTEAAHIRERVGYMAENESLVPGLNAVELCAYAAELSGLPRGEAMQRAHATLYYAGLDEKRYQPVETYSTGQKQRVKLAQALVHDPELLFLDEPTNGLDPRAREDMLRLIAELPARRGCTVVLSTHLLPDVERLCDHVFIMHKGQQRFSGTIESLRATHGREGTFAVEVKENAAAMAAALSEAGAAATVTSPITVLTTLPAGTSTQLLFACAVARGLQVRQIEVPRESLEAAFLRMIETKEAA